MTKKKTQSQIARDSGVSKQAVSYRKRRGLPLEGPSRAVGGGKKGRPRNVESLAEIARKLGLSRGAIYDRKRRGVPLDAPRVERQGPRKCKTCGARGHLAKTCGRELTS